MKYSIYILLIAVITSCSLEKRLAKYCPMCPDTIETVVEYRDTTIHDTIPGESITTIDSLYCDSLGNVYMITISEQQRENMRLRRMLSNNRLTTDCNTDTVVREVYVEGVDKVVKETKKINIPTTPKWVYIVLGVMGALLFMLLLIILLKNRKNGQRT